MSVLLELEGVCVSFGERDVVREVSLQVREGGVVALLGLNGAGKSVTARAAAGLIPLRRGAVRLAGRDITTTAAEARVGLGLRLLPQVGGVVPRLTVAENLRIGAFLSQDPDPRVRDLLHELFPILWERRRQRAGTLSGGEQQMLAIGRGLMAGPRLLLIDEASLGLSPKLARQVFETIRRINEEGVTVLMVEQNAGVLEIASRAFIMQKGRIEYEGSGQEILEQGELRKAYLGAPA